MLLSCSVIRGPHLLRRPEASCPSPSDGVRRSHRLLQFGWNCAIAATLPALAVAQDPRSAGATASVRGVVFDSLAQRPLAGALVWTTTGQRGTTDSAGRFLLSGLPADDQPVLLAASHAVVDSVGLSTLATRVRVSAGDTSDATIAIPSYHTLHAAACAGIEAAGDGDGILFGAIRSVGTETVGAGAVVEVRWRSFRSRGEKQLPEVLQAGLDATAGGDGTYYACGVPTSSALVVRARAVADAADATPSDEIVLTIGPRRILRRDVLLGNAEQSMLSVTVVDSDGRPISGARVFVGDQEPVTTTPSGSASLRKVATGTRVVGARFIGFSPNSKVVNVVPADTLWLTLRLDPLPPLLPTIRINSLLSEIEERRALGGGYIMSGEELERAPNLAFSVPMNSSIRNESKAGMLDLAVRGRLAGWCRPRVLLDGHPSGMDELSMYRPDELLAIELYVSPFAAPEQFMRAGDYKCGLLLAWTKR